MQSPTTPKTISNEVLEFCSSISSSEPFYVNVKTESYSKPLSCFPNVQEKIKISDGKCLHGWQVWMLTGIFIEAEFHGIWESPNNEYIDITPKKNKGKTILFLPDAERTYIGKQVNNIRHPLNSNGLIPQYFLTFDALFALTNFEERENQFEVILVGEEAEIRQWLVRWQVNLERMIMEGLSKNSLCPCGTGNKYKRCCGESFEQGIKKLKVRYKF